MATNSLVIEPFDFVAAEEQEWNALHTFANELRAERRPDDPPLALEALMESFYHTPFFVTHVTWLAWANERTVLAGRSEISLYRTETNRLVADFSLEVAPAWRRQGIGRRLLTTLAELAHAEGRRLLVTGTSSRVPAGEAFLLRLGAERGLSSHTEQLDLAALDRALLTNWLTHGQNLNNEFELLFWSGAYPPADLAALAALWTASGIATPGDPTTEPTPMTPERLREIDEYVAALGGERWTMVARERATGELAAFAQLTWNPSRPTLVNQGDAGVAAAYGNRGLERWLQAALLESFQRERPQVRLVRSGQANTHPLLVPINRELGFQPYEIHTFWQLTTQQALAFGRDDSSA
jgi:mycothiol synthase